MGLLAVKRGADESLAVALAAYDVGHGEIDPLESERLNYFSSCRNQL